MSCKNVQRRIFTIPSNATVIVRRHIIRSGADLGFQVRNFLGYFVWKITILCKKIIFFPILGAPEDKCLNCEKWWFIIKVHILNETQSNFSKSVSTLKTSFGATPNVLQFCPLSDVYVVSVIQWLCTLLMFNRFIHTHRTCVGSTWKLLDIQILYMTHDFYIIRDLPLTSSKLYIYPCYTLTKQLLIQIKLYDEEISFRFQYKCRNNSWLLNIKIN